MELLISLNKDGMEYTVYSLGGDARIVLKLHDNHPEMCEVPSQHRYLVGCTVKAINALRDVYSQQYFLEDVEQDYHRNASRDTDAMVKKLEYFLLDIFDGIDGVY